jgi:hypothetical protein
MASRSHRSTAVWPSSRPSWRRSHHRAWADAPLGRGVCAGVLSCAIGDAAPSPAAARASSDTSSCRGGRSLCRWWIIRRARINRCRRRFRVRLIAQHSFQMCRVSLAGPPWQRALRLCGTVLGLSNAYQPGVAVAEPATGRAPSSANSSVPRPLLASAADTAVACVSRPGQLAWHAARATPDAGGQSASSRATTPAGPSPRWAARARPFDRRGLSPCRAQPSSRAAAPWRHDKERPGTGACHGRLG